MWITWLVMLRQTPETSIGTLIVRKKTLKAFHPWQGRMERVLLSRTSKRQRNSMVSLRMCSIKMNTPRYRFWIGLHPSWMILLFLRKELIKLLKGLNPSKALGPDVLHPRVLINGHWWNPKGIVSCTYLPPFQEEWQVTCVQLSPGFLDLCTLQVTRTHSMLKYHGSSWWI